MNGECILDTECRGLGGNVVESNGKQCETCGLICDVGNLSATTRVYDVFTADKKSWNDAKNDCIGRGGALAQIFNANENAEILSKIGNEQAWIGMSDTHVCNFAVRHHLFQENV